MMYRIYKTLFFALLSIVFWIGSVILAFFGGAIFTSMLEDKKKREQEEKEGGPGHVRYTGPTAARRCQH